MARRAPDSGALGRYLLALTAVPVVLRLGDLFGQWLEARWYGPGQVFRWTFFLAGMAVFFVLAIRHRPE